MTTTRLETFIAGLSFQQGLIPVIAQQFDSKEVLMLAYMNEEAIRRTFESGYVTYYSRSRQELWRKGETSGHLQKFISLAYDCDADTLLVQVDQIGPACHTGTKTCFTGRNFTLTTE